MKFKKLLSLKSLIILGFMITIIPLFLGVIYAGYGLRETAELGRTINSQVFEQTKTIRLVLQKASDIERKARLFVLLSDPALRQPYERESYESARISFKQSLSDLLKLHVDNKIALLVNELSEKENLIYQQIISSESNNQFKLPIDEAFQGLRESSNTLSREFEGHVEHTFNELHQLSKSLEQGLMIKGVILLLLIFSVVFVFLRVLSQSMLQLDTAIRRLGAGELQDPIEVTGPADLHYLGERLEWLRTHLIALESSKQQLMHNLAREIEQPLQVIRDNSDQITNTNGSISPLLNNQLEAGLEKLQSVSEQLLKYSQLQTTSNPVENQNLDMRDILETTLSSFSEAIADKSLRINKLTRPTPIVGIAEQCQGIVEELLANAIEFSPRNGEIRILLRDSGDWVELEIEDDGPGINTESRQRVFEPFYRNHPRTYSKDQENHGFGLAMVKEYVTHHQGKIEFIDPRQDHQGARVRVLIPLKSED
jgi:two-component system sensor histidine kinase GlrK